MTPPTHIRAVIFDMDGLMLNTEIVAKITWKQAFQEFGYTLDEQTYPRIIGRKYPDIGCIFREQYGADFPYEAVSARRDQLGEDYFSEHGVDTKPGLAELLDFLDSRHILTAVASSTIRKRVMRRLTLADVSERFEAIICGDDVSRGKPAPDIFLKAAEQISMPPEVCLVLEDSNPGIEAAHNAGMSVIMVPDLKAPSGKSRKLASHIVSSLLDVKQLLEQNGVLQ